MPTAKKVRRPGGETLSSPLRKQDSYREENSGNGLQKQLSQSVGIGSEYDFPINHVRTSNENGEISVDHRKGDENGTDAQSTKSWVEADGISNLFDRAFTFTRLELQRLVEGQAPATGTKQLFTGRILGQGSAEGNTGNQNVLIQELKTALKTLVEEVDALKIACVNVERKYKDATEQATYDLRRSMNILFRLQQQTSLLDLLKSEKEKLLVDKM